MNKSVSGITQRNKRSIQEVGKKRRGANSGSGNSGGNGRPHRQRPGGERGSQRATTFGLWFVGIVGILFLFFLFSVVFAETTVTVYPKTAEISIDRSYTASNNPQVSGVSYSLVSAEDTVELTASSTGTEYREAVASGEITIYNEYSSESIQLVPNTRFQTESGLVYRTREGVTVPGQSSDGPGTVSVMVDAAEAGSEYNVAPTRFSIPGFAGTDYEGAVYAESTAAMTGGIAREVPIMASSTRQSLEEQAAQQLRQELVGRVAADLPEGFIMYEDGQFFSIEITGSENISTSTSALTVTGQLDAVTFDGRQLSTHLATIYSDDVSADADIRIQDLEDFEFAINDRSNVAPSQNSSFEFSLTGNSQIIWQYDERALVRDLRGLQKDRLNEVLVNYPSIQEAEVVTRPFWKRALPSSPEEISINTVIR